MTDKYAQAETLYQSLLEDIKANPEQMKKVLDTGSNLYRYSFGEQLIISHVMPEATAVATYAQWNKLRCVPKRGTKGIALPQDDGKLKYVFDTQNVVTLQGGRKPERWEYTPDMESRITQKLQQDFEIPKGGYTLSDKLMLMSEKFAEELLDDLVADLQEENLNVPEEWKSAITQSMSSIMAYSMMKRMGLDTEFLEMTGRIRFNELRELPVELIASISSKITEQSGAVLHAIGMEVLSIQRERRKEYDRSNNLSSRGRLSNSQYSTQSVSGRSERVGQEVSQIYKTDEAAHGGNAEDVRKTTSESIGTSEVGRADGRGNEETTDREIRSDEQASERETFRMGNPDEADRYGDRTGNNGTNYLRITSLERNKENSGNETIPSEAEQIGNIIRDMLRDNSVPQDVKNALDTVINYLPDAVKGSISAFYELNGANSQSQEFIAKKMAQNVPVLDEKSDGVRISDRNGQQIDFTWETMQGVIVDKIENGDFAEESIVAQAKEELIVEQKEKATFDIDEYERYVDGQIRELKDVPFSNFPLVERKEDDTYYTIRSASLNKFDSEYKTFEDSETAKSELKLQIKYAAYKEDSLDDKKQLKGISSVTIQGTENINRILEELEERKSIEMADRGMAIEPVVTINWSEHDNPLMGDSMRLSLLQADSLFQTLDSITRDERSEEGYSGHWYYKTQFAITYMLNGEICHYNGRQDFGDGNGSLLEHIEGTANDNIKFFEEQGKEDFQENIEVWKDVLEQFVPYLQNHMMVSKTERFANETLAKLPETGAEELREKMNAKLAWCKYARECFNNGGFPSEFEENIQKEAVPKETDLTELEETYPQIKDFVPKEQPKKSQEFIQIEVVPEETKLTSEIKESLNEDKNFVITDDHLGEGTPKEKCQRNLEAIRTMKSLEVSKVKPTDIQKQVMSQYVGWGGLADIFDERKDNWASERKQLRELLTEEEYKSARASTLDAFYTSPVIIEAIYEKLADMGLTEGRLLEPSCAVGNFIGKIPEDMNLSVTGVELDSITGRIAKQLYPEADIQVKGFEKTEFVNNTFDVAVGNVPFGNIKPYDKEYNKDKLLIHDYFFNKALDKVKPNGVVAFITSSGTLDKKDSHARELMSQKANFLGAVRLPNTAFKKNAGTEVTSDIIFLQKKAEPNNEIDDTFVKLGRTENGIEVNQYFVEHPEMVCGKLEMVSGQFGYVMTCQPDESRPLSIQLSEAMENIRGTINTYHPDVELEDVFSTEPTITDVEARNYSYVVYRGDIYFKENTDTCVLQTDKAGNALSGKTAERIKGLCELRDTTYELLDMQADPSVTDLQIQDKQAELLHSYNKFVKSNGRINDRGNALAFRSDDSYYLLTSLEKIDDNNKFIGLADIFTERTVQPIQEITQVDTPHDALVASMNRYAEVDIEYMATLCGNTKEEIIKDLINKEIFLNPANNRYETADEYLSGNVRNKLRIAEEAALTQRELFQGNVEQLKAVQPVDLSASDISVRLGATWIEPSIIKEFIKEKLHIPNKYLERNFRKPPIQISYNKLNSQWSVSGKSCYSNPQISTVFGTKDKNALEILETSLNLKPVKVTRKDENGNLFVDEVATKNAMAKQDELSEVFKEWIFDDPDRREKLVALYNERFNSIRPREYDGAYLSFAGMNPQINLKKHQKDAVARQVFGGNTLLAHCVGAGKTFTMAAAGMEMKRIGVAKKPLYVVPKPLVGQWAKEFATLYPTARVLAAGENDFSPANRKKFTTKIATGNYDAIIISHNQFEKIPLSKDYLESCIEKEIAETMAFIEESKGEGNRMSVKQGERTLKSLRERLEKLTDIEQDNVITFENLGVDHIFVDESHKYKNLPFHTKMQVAGINGSDNKSCTDMLYKCQYINEMTGHKGVTFATGTPVSNSMTELYSNMKYLQPDVLAEMGCSHFDQWAANFGNTVTAMEFDVTGQGFHQKTRFAEFFNLPELMSAFKESADVRTPDMLNLDTPDYSINVIDIDPSKEQKAFVDVIVKRCELVHSGTIDAKEDNMLKITTDGRKLAFDQRLLDPNLPENPNSKINVCVNKAFEIYKEGENEKVTQLIFSDLGVPNSEGRFDAYHEIKNKLIEKGVPEEQIAVIHDFETNVKKAQLQEKMRAGDIRFLIGSTAKCGTGLNVQTKLKALHHLDVPWRPSDIEQREGRIIRQGNENKNVDIFRYVTKGTFDTYSWQIIEQKQKFVGQIMTSKTPVRSMQDIDNAVIEAATAKALASGNMLVLDKANLEKDVSKLKIAKASYKNTIYSLQDQIRNVLPNKISVNQELLRDQLADSRILKANDFDSTNKDDFRMVVNGTAYVDKKEAGAALIDYTKKHAIERQNGISCGEYKGFSMSASYDFFSRQFTITLKGKANHSVYLSEDPNGMITRLDNVLKNIANENIPNIQNKIQDYTEQLMKANEEVSKPFPKEQELKEKEKKLADINAQLEADLINDSSGKNTEEIEINVPENTVLEKNEQKAEENKEVGCVVETPQNINERMSDIDIPIDSNWEREFKNFSMSEENENGKFTLNAEVKGIDGSFSNHIIATGKTRDELLEWAKDKNIILEDKSQTISGKIQHKKNDIKAKDMEKNTPGLSGQPR